MAFAAGAVGRGAASKAGTQAASKAGSQRAAGWAGKQAGDAALAEEVAAFNRQAEGKPAAKTSPEPAAPPAAGSGGSPSKGSSSSKPKGGGNPAKALSAAASDDRGTPKWFKDASKVSSPTYALNAGGGAVLGCMAWVLGLTYLREGGPGVKRWFRAKFFNQVTSS